MPTSSHVLKGQAAPLRHDLSDRRGDLVFCKECGSFAASLASSTCTPAPLALRHFRVESVIEKRMHGRQDCPCSTCRPSIDPVPKALPPLHSAHTQHLHALIGGWNRRAPVS